MTHYFTVREANGDFCHIGTLEIETNQEFVEKLTEACSQHFDADVSIRGDIHLSDYLYGPKLATILIAQDDEPPYKWDIEIERTFIY